MAVNEIPQHAIMATVEVSALVGSVSSNPSIQSLIDTCKADCSVSTLRKNLDPAVLGDRPGKTIGTLIALMLPNTASNEPVVSDLVNVVEQNFSHQRTSDAAANCPSDFWQDLENALMCRVPNQSTGQRSTRISGFDNVFAGQPSSTSSVCTLELPVTQGRNTTRQFDIQIPSPHTARQGKHVQAVCSPTTPNRAVREEDASQEMGIHNGLKFQLPPTPRSTPNTGRYPQNHSRRSSVQETESPTQRLLLNSHITPLECSSSSETQPGEEMAPDADSDCDSSTLLPGIEDFL